MSTKGIDPEIMSQLASLAQQLAWKNPNVEVLRSEFSGQYPLLITIMQDKIRASHQRGKLVLPNLEVFGNEAVAVFSDYSGESSGRYHTYSFLTCAWNTIGHFSREMDKVRMSTGLGSKEIAFKDFRMGQMQRALPDYLSLLDNLVPGLLLTVVVDKSLTSLFGRNEKSTQTELATTLREQGFGEWKPDIAEKLARVVHIGAFLIGLLATSGQKVFWMTDDDAICANEEMHHHALELFNRFLAMYTDSNCHFSTVGGASPFKERHMETLDLPSTTDIVASSVEHYLSRKDANAPRDFEVKAGSDKVLQWLAHDGISLKKMNIIIRQGKMAK